MEQQDDVQMDERLKDKFSVMGIWNKFLTFEEQSRKLEARNHIWATEIGKAYYDRWHKMKAVPAEEYYSVRVLRKFQAGNMFERLVGFVLVISGILQADNEHVSVPATKDMLEVTGYFDFKAGGKPKKWEDIQFDDFVKLFFKFFPSFERIAESLNKQIIEKYPNGLPELVYEVKTVNSQLFWAKKNYLTDAYPHHQFQLMTYLIANNIPEGRILYISKDDLTLAEFPVYLNNAKLRQAWENDVKEMTKLYRLKEPPAIPDLVVYDKRKKLRFQHKKIKYIIQGCYTDNWEIKWSNYLKQMGFKDLDDYSSKCKPIISEKNAELKDKYKVKHNLLEKKQTKEEKKEETDSFNRYCEEEEGNGL